MRIQGSSYNLINSLYGQAVNKNAGSVGLTGLKSVDKGQKNDIRTGWVKGSANIDINSSTSVRKQMQDQLRELFEKERARSSPLINDDKDKVAGTEKEDDDKKDKLLDSGRIYNFKEVSNKIMRAKTSISAGQAVVAAKRKVSELKRKLAVSGGDDDELQVALTHARKMEVVAERKKNNLTLEEMVNNTRKRDELIKKMEESVGSGTAEVLEELKDKVLDKQLDHIEEQSEIRQQEMLRMQEKMREEAEENIEASEEKMMEQMNSFAEEMNDGQSEMLREMSEMIDAMETVDPHMSKEELDKLKLKHRLSEQKALMKADMDYLKSVFKQLDGRSGTGTPGMGSGSLTGSSGSFSFAGMFQGSTSGAVAVSVDAGAGAVSASSVDVTV